MKRIAKISRAGARTSARETPRTPARATPKRRADLDGCTDILEDAPIGYLRLTSDGLILEANPLAVRILRGSGRSLIQGVRFASLLCREDQSVFRSFLLRLSKRGSLAPRCHLRLGKAGQAYVRLDPWGSGRQHSGRFLITDVTAENAEKTALLAARDRLELVQWASGAGVWDRDLLSGATEWSSQLCKIYGYDPNTVAPSFENWAKLLHPEDRAKVLAEVRQTLGHRRDMFQEYRIIRPNGEVRWIRSLGRAVRDRTGKPVRILGISMDVTGRKQGEQALVELQKRLELVHRAAGAGAWEWDLPGGTLAWSEHLSQVHGLRLSKGTPRLTDWLNSIHPEDRHQAQQRTTEALKKRRDFVNEYRVVLADGRTRWIRSLGRAMYDQQGRPARLLGISLDITDEKRAEQALKESRAELEVRVQERTAELEAANAALRESQTILRGFFDNSPFLMGVAELVGKEMILVSANALVARMLGCEPETVRGRRGSSLFSDPETNRKWVQQLETCQLEDRPVRFEHLRVLSGEEHWFNVTLAFLGSGPRGYPRFSFVVENTTEQKRSEQFLIAQRDLSEKLSSMDAIEPAAAHLLEVATRLYGLDSGGLYLAGPHTGSLHLVAHRGLSERFVDLVRNYAPDTAQMRLVMAGVPVFGSIDQLPPLIAESCRLEGLRSLAVIPIRHEEKLIGVLNIASHVREEIPHSARLAIQSLAGQAAGAIVRLQTEAARRDSDARLRAIVENAPIVVFAGTTEGVLTFEEGRALRDLGFQPGENVGRPVLEAYQGVTAIADNVRRVLAGEEFSALVQLGPNSFETWYTPIRDNVGRITGYFGIGTNVTERIRLERQIIEISDRAQSSFGQELHDGLSQVLVGVAFDVNALRGRLTHQVPSEIPVLARICGSLDDAITEARRLSRGLFPVKLENYGLTAALRDLTETLGRRSSIQTRFVEIGGPVTITDNVAAIHLFRIAQEAMNNAAKHSGAKRLGVQLILTRQALCLSITDDGCGIRLEGGKTTGLGLHIMDYRARALGGNLQIRARPRGGTEVLCEVPWSRTQPKSFGPSLAPKQVQI